jgi:hypothetical protein
MIVSLILSIASLVAPVAQPVPSGPPVQGPCAFPRPEDHYTPWNGYGPCYTLYLMRLDTNKAAYWIRVTEQCAGGDCQCYADAIANFLAQMKIAEQEYIDCVLSGGN